MNISIEPILIEQKSVFMQMMELYSYDFSEFSDKDINEYGHFGYPRIDDYWNEEGRYPFFIRVDGELAGLVLVRSCCEYNNLPDPHNIAEFFVMKKYRRKGVGKAASMKIFDMFPGGWEVSQWENNLPAQNFWKQVIGRYTNGKYETFTASEKGSVGFTFYNGIRAKTGGASMTIRFGTDSDKEIIFAKRPHAAGFFSDGGYFVVAEENGEIVGFAAVFGRKIPAPVEEAEAFINLIEVFEEYQKSGVASAMVQKIVETEKPKGTYQVRAYCEISNAASHALLRKTDSDYLP